MTPNELRAKRATAIGHCRGLVDRARAEGRELTADEQQQYDRAWEEQGSLKAQVEKIEGEDRRRQLLEGAERELAQPLAVVSPGRPGAFPGGPNAAPGDGASEAAPYCFQLVRGGRRSGNPAQQIQLAAGTPSWQRHRPQYRQAFARYLQSGHASPVLHEAPLGPQAALQTDIGTAGGYMVLPEQFVSELLMDVDDIRWIRQLARVFTTNAQTLGVVKRTAKMKSFQWGSELTDAGATKDTTLAYGKRSLTPHYMVGEILLSRDLLRSAILPVEEFVRYEIARDSGELEENGFLTGNGTQQPLGLFTADANGIDTGRDVSVGNTTTNIGTDNLREMKYTLKPQYRAHPSLRFLYHKDAVKQISKLKDGEGQYLWRDGITAGDPDTILGIPLTESLFAPNTFTTGQYVGLLGAFFFYWIADSLEMDLLILQEKYAETNQLAYVARRKTDGMPQIAEAFVRSKLA